MVSEFLETIRSKGFDPAEFGLTEETVRRRLEMAAQSEREVAAVPRLVQPQQRREALQTRVFKEARSIADTVINRLHLKHAGKGLVRYYPGKGPSNASILIALASGAQNRAMSIPSGDRNQASIEHFEAALEASADIADNLTVAIRRQMGR